MIIVCACCTTRMLFEITTMMARTAAPTRIVPGPIGLELLLDHESGAVYLDDRDLRAGLDHGRVRRRPAPVFTFHFDPSGHPRPDPLGDDARLPEQGIDARSQVGTGSQLEVLHEARP